MLYSGLSVSTDRFLINVVCTGVLDDTVENGLQIVHIPVHVLYSLVHIWVIMCFLCVYTYRPSYFKVMKGKEQIIIDKESKLPF